MSKSKSWYAIYTKPRWEKKVHRQLTEMGLNSYCPLNQVKRKWSDRVKLVEEPLFKSYVFVELLQKEMQEVRMTTGVVNFVYWLGKPAVIRQEEIETIQRFLKEYSQVQALPLTLKPQQRIKMNRGLLINKEGVVRKVLNSRKVEVILESIGFKLVAIVDTGDLEAI